MQIADQDGFRKQMNTTRPGQIIAITTGQGNTYQVNLTAKDEALADSGGFIGIAIFPGRSLFRS
jgi:hypothetical protein